MLVSLLACIYITSLCSIWGTLVIKVIERACGINAGYYHFSIKCLAGFATITVAGGLLSLFVPLGTWQAQVLFLLPCIGWAVRTSRRRRISLIPAELSNLSAASRLLLAALLLLILLMSAYPVSHPDTLGYHAQTIQWIEKYKAIPGLVHLHTRYGYQGLWYVACAIFSFRFADGPGLTYINLAIVIWFTVFAVSRMETLVRQQSFGKAMLWLGLLTYSLWDYIELRLTSTSAGPDFIAAILTWTALILVPSKAESKNTFHLWSLCILFCFFSITVRLSAIPLLIVAFYGLFQLTRAGQGKALFATVILAFLILLPFLARNVITSGYLIFPSRFPDLISADWKYDPQRTQLEKDYIQGYARGIRAPTKEATQYILYQNNWMSVWWEQLSAAYKFLIVIAAVNIILGLVWIRKILLLSPQLKVIIGCEAAGILLWFLQAPDPRFGLAFLIAFPATMASNIIIPRFSKNIFSDEISKRISWFLTLVLGFGIGAYAVYRLLYFFSISNVWQPAGVPETNFLIHRCGDIEFHIPSSDDACNSIPLPCAYDSCKTFELRGKEITDGFKAKTGVPLDPVQR
jgi:hypothetical protein